MWVACKISCLNEVVFFHIMVALEDFSVHTGNYSQGTGNALVTGANRL